MERAQSLSTVSHSDDVVFHPGYVEVQEQAKWFVAQFQIRKQLNSMHGRYRLAGFQFEDNDIFYRQIDAVAEFKPDRLVDH